MARAPGSVAAAWLDPAPHIQQAPRPCPHPTPPAVQLHDGAAAAGCGAHRLLPGALLLLLRARALRHREHGDAVVWSGGRCRPCGSLAWRCRRGVHGGGGRSWPHRSLPHPSLPQASGIVELPYLAVQSLIMVVITYWMVRQGRRGTRQWGRGAHCSGRHPAAFRLTPPTPPSHHLFQVGFEASAWKFFYL